MIMTIPVVLSALLMTLILEFPVFLVGYRKEEFSVKYKITVFVLINVITNLLINSAGLILRDYIYKITGNGMWIVVLIVEEIAVVITEAYVYKKAFMTGFKKPLLVSLAANAVSAILGSYLISALTRF